MGLAFKNRGRIYRDVLNPNILFCTNALKGYQLVNELNSDELENVLANQ